MKLLKEIDELIDARSAKFVDALCKSNIREDKIKRMIRETLKGSLTENEIEKVIRLLDETDE